MLAWRATVAAGKLVYDNNYNNNNFSAIISTLEPYREYHHARSRMVRHSRRPYGACFVFQVQSSSSGAGHRIRHGASVRINLL